VIYEIAPDRFADGDKANDPKGTALWTDSPAANTVYGGDAKGVEDHLQYLLSLGANTVLLDPPAASFGDDHQVESLIQDLDRQGLRVLASPGPGWFDAKAIAGAWMREAGSAPKGLWSVDAGGGGECDSRVDATFGAACVAFATGDLSPTDFANKLMDSYGRGGGVAHPVSGAETGRILTRCHSDDSVAKIVLALQFTWPGIPVVLYGDELGMTGGPEPDELRPMNWDLDVDTNSWLSLYQTLIHLRETNSALETGSPTILEKDDAAGTLAYARISSDQAILVLVNRSRLPQDVRISIPSDLAVQISAPNGFQDLISSGSVAYGRDHRMQLTLPPVSVQILVPASGQGSGS